MPRLGVEGFWRQIDRFLKHHTAAGTVDNEAWFAERLTGWLERADSNRKAANAY